MGKNVGLAAVSVAIFLGSGIASATTPPCTSPCIVTDDYNVVKRSVTTVNGLAVDQVMWFDSRHLPRTVSLKREGSGNAGHGGYAIQMTYVTIPQTPTPHYQLITVNAESSGDGGFGYFVSHERDRWFGNDKQGNPILATIANKVFGVDDSPLGLDFAVTESFPATSSGSTQSLAVRYKTTYKHYGTITPDAVNPNTGLDQTPLSTSKSDYNLYSLPVTLTWVFEAFKDDPRFIVTVNMSAVGSADLVNFDMRAPYGVMVFDNGADKNVSYAAWGDEQYLFAPATKPITRSTSWDWSQTNTGARFNLLQANGYEMGLYEPLNVANTLTRDSYAGERGFTAQSYATAGGTSYDSCSVQTAETLPSDGTWPYQSVQYSLPCPTADTTSAIHTALTSPTTFKKLAWGTTAYYGSSLTSVYNGQSSFPFNGYPSSKVLSYPLCISLAGARAGGTAAWKASAYIAGNPNKIAKVCATATL